MLNSHGVPRLLPYRLVHCAWQHLFTIGHGYAACIVNNKAQNSQRHVHYWYESQYAEPSTHGTVHVETDFVNMWKNRRAITGICYQSLMRYHVSIMPSYADFFCLTHSPSSALGFQGMKVIYIVCDGGKTNTNNKCNTDAIVRARDVWNCPVGGLFDWMYYDVHIDKNALPNPVTDRRSFYLDPVFRGARYDRDSTLRREIYEELKVVLSSTMHVDRRHGALTQHMAGWELPVWCILSFLNCVLCKCQGSCLHISLGCRSVVGQESVFQRFKKGSHISPLEQLKLPCWRVSICSLINTTNKEEQTCKKHALNRCHLMETTIQNNNTNA